MPKAGPIPAHWTLPVLRDFPPSRRYLIGVSGGRDSVALLHLLLARGYRKLVVCHLDHRLRGRASTADARFVERLAKAHALAFESKRIDVRRLAGETRQSLETAGRAARLEFFAGVARRRRCRVVFLGHHADDLVETFLINLFRGSGTRGQRSIQGVTTREVDGTDLTIVRPLLAQTRAELAAYVEQHRLRFREDASNQSLDSLRNRVRHRVIPLLGKEFERDIRGTVRRAAVIAADDDVFLTGLLPAPAERLAVKQLRKMPAALQRRAIARWLSDARVAGVGFEVIEGIRAMLDPVTAPAKINLPGDRHARRRSGELFIEP